MELNMNLMNAFKKKDENDVPDVSSMINSGMSQQDIIDSLRQQGYDSTTIKNALINALKSNATFISLYFSKLFWSTILMVSLSWEIRWSNIFKDSLSSTTLLKL